jgi:hypothetical protein
MSLKFEFWDRKIVKKRWEKFEFWFKFDAEFSFDFNFQMVLKVDVAVMMRLFCYIVQVMSDHLMLT